MKKLMVILLVVLLLTLTFAGPVFAADDDSDEARQKRCTGILRALDHVRGGSKADEKLHDLWWQFNCDQE